MNIDLPGLLGRFRAFNDFENSVALYRTQVPWVGPEAYFNVIYRPAASHVLSQVGIKLQFPDSILEFLGRYNGAKLFSGALNLYGVVEAGHMLNRQESFLLPPFNIEEANRLWQTDPENLLVIGGYRFDGSRVCVSRLSGQILLFRKKGREPELSWNSFDSWLDGMGASTWHVKGNLYLTGYQWSSNYRTDDRGRNSGYSWFFDFNDGRSSNQPSGFPYSSSFRRALCVRGK